MPPSVRLITNCTFPVLFAAALVGCADSSSGGEASKTPTEPSASSRNDRVIREAERAQDNQAQKGAEAIRATLRERLNLNEKNEFDLDHQFDEGQIGGDCYVKLGAEAANFESQPENTLYSANGRDLVFVQSSTTTPLVKCLKAVRSALGW